MGARPGGPCLAQRAGCARGRALCPAAKWAFSISVCACKACGARRGRRSARPCHCARSPPHCLLTPRCCPAGCATRAPASCPWPTLVRARSGAFLKRAAVHSAGRVAVRRPASSHVGSSLAPRRRRSSATLPLFPTPNPHRRRHQRLPVLHYDCEDRLAGELAAELARGRRPGVLTCTHRAWPASAELPCRPWLQQRTPTCRPALPPHSPSPPMRERPRPAPPAPLRT